MTETVVNSFTLEQVRQHWNRVSHHYDEANADVGGVHYQRFREARRYLQLEPGLLVLDMFTRTANSLRFLFDSDVTVVCAELSEGMLEQAKKKFPSNVFVHSSPHDLPYTSNSFDRILSLESLEHVPVPARFLSELRRVLKPGGILVMSVPPAILGWVNIVVDMFSLYHSEGPCRNLSSRTVKHLLSEAGFVLVKHKGTVLVPLGPRFLKKWGVWLEDRVQGTPIAEFGIRQFYVCKKTG